MISRPDHPVSFRRLLLDRICQIARSSFLPMIPLENPPPLFPYSMLKTKSNFSLHLYRDLLEQVDWQFTARFSLTCHWKTV
ncbi:MAG: hypothetical protein KDA65_03865 [Planctomycetaceae bacterium]|nr:hypothetical protein [Planctomycetaceae bacterium]